MRRIAFISIIVVFVVAGLAYVQFSENKPANDSPSRDQEPDGLSEAELEKLSSLPYTNWSSARADLSKKGVVRYEHGRVFPGDNLYNSRNLSSAQLIDMAGKVLHTWALPKEGGNSWHSIHLLPNGDLLALIKDQKLVRLSRNSDVRWEYEAQVHHDVAVSHDGRIYVPTRRASMWKTKQFTIPVVKEAVTILSSDGTLIREIDLFDSLKGFIPQEKIQKIQNWAATENIPARLAKRDVPGLTWWENKKADAFHVNSIYLIERTIPGIAELGDILLSVRQLDLVCILRPDTGKLVWLWGPGEIECQHHATLLENNHVLLFDNGCKRRYSRVLEVSPADNRIVWEYKNPKQFFSHRRGAAQRLANGNTLITESDRGRVFEVTKNGQIVWEFLNPDVFLKEKKRAVIYRLMRFPDNFFEVTK